MKTLDEVITAFEICIVDNDGTCKGCPYSDENGEPICIGDDKEDALNYLKEYREMKEHLACLDTATLHGENTTKYRRRNNENVGRSDCIDGRPEVL